MAEEETGEQKADAGAEPGESVETSEDADSGTESRDEEKSAKTKKKARKRPNRRNRVGPTAVRWLGDGRFVPFALVAVCFIAAAWQFFSNPYEAELKSIAALRAGKLEGIEPVIHLGLHLGALIALSILGAWLLASPWWARLSGEAAALIGSRKPRRAKKKKKKVEADEDSQKEASDSAPAGGMPARWFWLLVVLAVVAGGVLRYPRLFHGFWNDEEVAHRKFIHGSHRLSEDRSIEFKPVTWKRTWFYNVTGNNHVLQSVGSRATLDLFGGEKPGRNEALTRTLPLAAGLLTIVALAMLVRGAGAPFAGVVAAWLLALHPWHLRYSVEARGYSMMLLFAVLMFLSLRGGLKNRSWLAWALFGLCQLACLVTFPAAIYLVLSINVGVIGVLIARRDSLALRRWATVCAVGAAVFCQVMTPALLRMVEWIASPYEVPRPLNGAYFLDLWSHVAAGLPLSDGHTVNAFRLDLDTWRKLGGLRYWMMIAILPGLVVAGCVVALIRKPGLRWPVAGVIGAVALAIVHVLARPMVFHGWYLLYLLLPFCIGLAVVAQVAWDWKRPVGLGVTALLFVAFGMVALAPIKRQRGFERHPMRPAVLEVRGEAPALSDKEPHLLTISLGPGSGQMVGYDPRVVVAKDEAKFFSALEKARLGQLDVAVYCSHADALPASMPKVAASLNDPALFRESDHILGVEAFWSIRIFRSVDAAEKKLPGLPGVGD